MNNKDFEKILKTSVSLFGHEYVDSNDPITPHSFPEHFISDITLKEPRSVKFRFSAVYAAAAVLAVSISVIIVVHFSITHKENTFQPNEESNISSQSNADIDRKEEILETSEELDDNIDEDYPYTITVSFDGTHTTVTTEKAGLIYDTVSEFLKTAAPENELEETDLSDSKTIYIIIRPINTDLPETNIYLYDSFGYIVTKSKENQPTFYRFDSTQPIFTRLTKILKG